MYKLNKHSNVFSNPALACMKQDVRLPPRQIITSGTSEQILASASSTQQPPLEVFNLTQLESMAVATAAAGEHKRSGQTAVARRVSSQG